LRDLPAGRYCFLHNAFLTRDKVAAYPLADYIARNRAISAAVAEAAAKVSVTGFFLPSSGAVYSKDRTLDRDLTKNPYGALKIEDEERFAALAEQSNFALAVVRVFNLSGPYINKIGSYALSSILDDILHRRTVVLKARHPVLRSYVQICDLIGLVLALLGRAKASDRWLFDTAGETVVEVGALAELARAVMGEPDLAIDRPALAGGEPEDRYVGDGAAMADLARRHDIVFRPLSEQIRDTADYQRTLPSPA
jgi:UDP-glucuronate decarboxylase